MKDSAKKIHTQNDKPLLWQQTHQFVLVMETEEQGSDFAKTKTLATIISSTSHRRWSRTQTSKEIVGEEPRSIQNWTNHNTKSSI